MSATGNQRSARKNCPFDQPAGLDGRRSVVPAAGIVIAGPG